MLKLSINNIITVSKGDSFEFPLFLNAGTAICPIRRVLRTGEYLYFAIEQHNQCFDNALLKKRFDKEDLNVYDDVVISLSAEEMRNICPGNYFYEIKASFLDDQGKQVINTVVEKTQFIVL